MKIAHILFCGLLTSSALVLAGRAEELSTNRVDFQKIEINGRPARMVLATSLPTTVLLEPGARRLGLKGAGISDLTQVTAGGQTFRAPFLLFGNPLDGLPWFYRQLIGFSHPVLYHEFKNLFGQISTGLEGVLGWPEVRDNILVFDPGQRTIRRVGQLPPETAGWLKLKVVPDRSLLLELPLPDGKTGTVWVDTADCRSVILPGWKEWKEAHPQSLVTSRNAVGLPLLIPTHHEARVDQITLGPLTLTDVAIEDMPADKVDDLLQETPSAKVVWVLGMAALTRMDLVVDGKNGWAYLHPKPPLNRPGLKSDMAKDAAAGGNWKVAENVRVSSDNLFVYSGELKWSKHDGSGALADYTRALEIDPRNADAWSDRGVVREVRGDFADAVSNYDKAIELRPEYSDWERLYRQTLLWRLDRSTAEEAKTVAGGKETPGPVILLKPVVVYGVAPDDFSKSVAGWKGGWTKRLGLFLAGKLDEKELLAAARKSEGLAAAEQKALAFYYIGMVCLRKGDNAGARKWFQKCRAAGFTGDDEYHFSVAELARLDAARRPSVQH